MTEYMTNRTFEAWLRELQEAQQAAAETFATATREKVAREVAGNALAFLEMATYRKTERLAWEAQRDLEVALRLSDVVALIEEGGSIRVFGPGGDVQIEIRWDSRGEEAPHQETVSTAKA